MKYATTPILSIAISAMALAVLSACSGNPGGSAGSAASATDSGPVVEVVNGEPVSQRLFDAFAAGRGIDLANPQAREKALKQVTELVLLSQVAKKQGYDKDPDMIAAAELGRLQGAAGATLKQLQKEIVVDDAALQAEYAQLAAKGGTLEYDFGQIVFADKDQAAKAAAAIAGGKTFDVVMEASKKDARMARSFTKIRSTQLPPPLAQALAALKPGETTKSPVQLPQGFVVLHLGAANTIPQPPFEQMKEGLRRGVIKRLSEERLTKLRDEAKVTLTDPPPQSLLPPRPAAQARPPMSMQQTAPAGMVPARPAMAVPGTPPPKAEAKPEGKPGA